MDMLKKLFPFSFGAADIKALVIKIVIYLLVSAVVGFVLGLIPGVGDSVGGIVGLYCTVGWILSVLDYLKVLK